MGARRNYTVAIIAWKTNAFLWGSRMLGQRDKMLEHAMQPLGFAAASMSYLSMHVNFLL